MAAIDLSVAALALAGVAAVGFVALRDHRRVVAARRRMFDACAGLFEQAELVQQGADFPRLEGARGGRAVTLRLIADNVNLRKLPALWLSVELREALPVPAALSVMNRARNTEFFSGHADLEEVLPIAPPWPETVTARSDAAAAGAAMLRRLSAHAEFFAGDPRAKEMAASPRGARLVWLAAEGVESHFMLLRQARFSDAALPAEPVAALIDRAFAIADALKAE